MKTAGRIADGTVTAALEPGRSGFHQSQHTFHDLVDIQAGGIDQDSIFSRPERGHRALGITGIAGEDLAQQTVDCD